MHLQLISFYDGVLQRLFWPQVKIRGKVELLERKFSDFPVDLCNLGFFIHEVK